MPDVEVCSASLANDRRVEWIMGIVLGTTNQWDEYIRGFGRFNFLLGLYMVLIARRLCFCPFRRAGSTTQFSSCLRSNCMNRVSAYTLETIRGR